MKVDAATRRANFWVFLGLVVFAIALCALILLWMRSRTHALGGTVYPPVTFFPTHEIWKSLVEIVPAVPLILPS